MRADSLETLNQVLDAEGVRGALRWLNRRTSHRFTGVWRFDPPMLRNLRLFDRQNPELEIGADAPMRETYCSIAGETGAPFRTEHAGLDPRLVEHPARDTTLAYQGVPLLGPDGAAVGTLCHFDVVPRSAPERETELLRAAAVSISERLRRDGLLPALPPAEPG